MFVFLFQFFSSSLLFLSVFLYLSPLGDSLSLPITLSSRSPSMSPAIPVCLSVCLPLYQSLSGAVSRSTIYLTYMKIFGKVNLIIYLHINFLASDRCLFN